MKSSIILDRLRDILNSSVPSEDFLHCDVNHPFFEDLTRLVDARLKITDLITVLKFYEKYGFED